MAFVLAVDGGSTKTHMVVGDDHGNILAQYVGGSSNHQVVSDEEASRAIREGVEKVLNEARLQITDISLAFMGLSGADMPEDHQKLTRLFSPILPGVPLRIVNDCWIALSSGAPDGWGAVAICGTGSNAAARNREGGEAVLRSLDYNLGAFGGGSDLTSEALHHAFRSEEGTGPKSALETEIPKLLGLGKLEDLVSAIYFEGQSVQDFPGIPRLVFELATAGDRVCQELLIEMGTTLGNMAAGVIRRVGLEMEKVPVVTAGSLFKGSNPLMTDAFMLALHRQIPLAYPVESVGPPVMGAYKDGLRHLKSRL